MTPQNIRKAGLSGVSAMPKLPWENKSQIQENPQELLDQIALCLWWETTRDPVSKRVEVKYWNP